LTDRDPTFVLVHGSGDTARVWRKVQPLLDHRSVAIDLLGRGSRPYDITRLNSVDAARAAAQDVRAQSSGPWIVVAHSAGAIIAPRLVVELGAVQHGAVQHGAVQHGAVQHGAVQHGAVQHLVLVAGLTAPEGGQAVDVIFPERRAEFEENRGPLLAAHRNHSYVPPRSASDPAAAPVVLPPGLEPLTSPRVAQAIDSMVLVFERFSWVGVPSDLPRTWVRCLRDSLQSPERQLDLIEAFGATQVLDIDTDHTPAREDPDALAALLNKIAGG
jgi:pimeloyl-ACP methyl ester carboxylesterase